ncbi:MAG: HI0074 family nucleotidyltransferase substrate-binding subunit [Candidatus Methylopumilus sp.]|jgi:nucleotidyltransferase substrate binding protein (TIGR01987 family)
MDRRFELALKAYEKALTRLNEVLAEPEDDLIRDALIKRFEFTFETAWKAMYRWLLARGAEVDEEAYSVLPRAYKNRLITADDAWADIRKKRNLTSHTYKEEMAIEVAAFVRSVAIHHFEELLVVLKSRAEE